MRITTPESDAKLRPHAATLEGMPRTGTPRTDMPRATSVAGMLIGERAHRFHFFDPKEVDYLQVDGNYVIIHVGDDCFITRATLKHLSQELTGTFVLIDRSRLINLRRIDYVERLESGRFAFKLRSGQQLISSRQRASRSSKLLHSGLR
jgi:DNA-binding LytR/AlgR family response regulator